jgi:hypothetical protein
MKLVSPVTDRTFADVTNRTAKGFINVSDWIRIYENAQLMSLVTAFLLNTEIQFDQLAEPTATSFPTVEDLNTLLANIQRAREASGLPTIEGLDDIKTDWTAGVSSASPNYVDANTWERVTQLVLTSVVASLEYKIYTGVANCGQERFYQCRWRVSNQFVPSAESPTRKVRMGNAQTGTGLTRQNSYRRYS